MHFDLFYELSLPDSADRSESQAFHDALAELEVADAGGFRTAWFVEHHFMREYSRSSAPDLMLAAAASRTRRLRLGHAIVPLPYHHPIEVAERLATLDILSHGRVEFGFGRGFSPREYEAFGVDMAGSRGRVEEALAVLHQTFAGGPVNFAGRHYRLADIEVFPKVVQRPHPPLWMAAVSPESFALAARLRVGMLAGPFKPWFMVRRDIARYREAWGQHEDAAAVPRVGMTIGLVCLEDHARARALAATHCTWFYRELLRHTAPVLERLYPGYEYYPHLPPLKALLSHAIRLPVLETLGMVVAGDPDHCGEKLRAYRDAGVDHLLCAVAVGGIPSEVVIESLQTLQRHIIPRFAQSAI